MELRRTRRCEARFGLRANHCIDMGLFIAAMLASIVSLTLFLREVYFAIETLEIALPAGTWQKASHASSTASAVYLFAKNSS